MANITVLLDNIDLIYKRKDNIQKMIIPINKDRKILYVKENYINGIKDELKKYIPTIEDFEDENNIKKLTSEKGGTLLFVFRLNTRQNTFLNTWIIDEEKEMLKNSFDKVILINIQNGKSTRGDELPTNTQFNGKYYNSINLYSKQQFGHGPTKANFTDIRELKTYNEDQINILKTLLQ